MKKFLSLTLALIMMLSCMSITIFADTDPDACTTCGGDGKTGEQNDVTCTACLGTGKLAYLDATNSSKEIEQKYDATVNTTYTDVTKVQVSWKLEDIAVTVTNNKVWDPDTLTWIADKNNANTASVEAVTAEFDFVNYSSMRLKGKVEFEAEDGFNPTVEYSDKVVTLLSKADDADCDNKAKITVTLTPDEDDFTSITANTNGTYGTYTVTISDTDPTEYTVTFDKQNGTGGTDSVIGENGSAMPAITAPTRTGYSFEGYYSKANGEGTKYYNADGTSAQSFDLLENTTLFANWTLLGYFLNASGELIGDYFTAEQAGLDAGNLCNLTGCADAKYIVLPGGVTSIKDNLFQFSSYGTFLAPAAPLEITIPNTVTTIGNSAFNASSIQKVHFQSGSKLTTIGTSAFSSSGNLTNIAIPEGVTTIGNSAFNGTALTAVTIPANVTTIGDSAFYNCKSLTTVTFAENSKLESIGVSAFDGCEKLQAISIPNAVTTICASAFADCTKLASVTIPESVKTIGETAFKNCTSITTLTIPSGVETIGENAFCKTGLTSVILPATLTTLGHQAFYECADLISATIPSSIETIGTYAFCECEKLASVTISNGVVTIGEGAFKKTALTTVTLPASVKTIGKAAFTDCASLTAITIPNGVETIGDSAFMNTGLTAITLPASVKTIGNSAFKECASLTVITIPSGINIIAPSAFMDTGLTAVTLPASVTEISAMAFYGCSGLTTITYLGTVADWNKISLVDLWKKESAITSVTINGTVHTLDNNGKIS